MNRIPHIIGRIATGISIVITVVAVVLLLTGAISGAVFGTKMLITVPLGAVSAIVSFVTGN